jgi:hypothetical protein
MKRKGKHGSSLSGLIQLLNICGIGAESFSPVKDVRVKPIAISGLGVEILSSSRHGKRVSAI